MSHRAIWLLVVAVLAGRAGFAAEKTAAPLANSRFTQAEFDRHLEKVKQLVPEGEAFTILVEPPFVVIGDESQAKVEKRAKNLVRWAVAKLKDAYFDKDPEEILDIWLFADDDSYRGHCKSIFGAAPDTPYGYFSPTDRALIMNIGTGGGTLVHEIVHPYIAANFPKCPPWFNEGLASLYEKANEENGRIRGYPNWRLPGLKKAIRREAVPPIKELCAMNAREFYQKDRGTNYSEARYLCYYLQEHDLLRMYYHAFVAAAGKDPTGYATLKKILKRGDMDAFEEEWRKWVLEIEED